MARTWFLLLLSLLCSSGGNVMLKGTLLGLLGGDASAAGGLPLARALLATPELWGGLLLYGMGFLLWIRVLAVEPVSKVYPVAASISFLFIMSASSQLLGERYSAASLLGVGLIGLGIVLCGLDLRRRPDAGKDAA